MKRKIIITVCCIVFIAALGVTLYPIIANYVNDLYESELQSEYDKKIEELDGQAVSEARKTAEEYNRSLLPVRYTKARLEGASVKYREVLALDKTGIMAYVEIPKIDVDLPVYHTTETEVLEKGIGHLVGSSVPIGGIGSHSVLTGHTGVAGKRLFSDLDQLVLGDVFYIHVLDKTLAYQVDAINVVDPSDTELLCSVDGEDLCTLVTCTPYGVNSHRLLVRGSRISGEEAKEIEKDDTSVPTLATWKKNYLKGILIGIGFSFNLAALIILIVKRRKREKDG